MALDPRPPCTTAQGTLCHCTRAPRQRRNVVLVDIRALCTYYAKSKRYISLFCSRLVVVLGPKSFQGEEVGHGAQPCLPTWRQLWGLGNKNLSAFTFLQNFEVWQVVGRPVHGKPRISHKCKIGSPVPQVQRRRDFPGLVQPQGQEELTSAAS